MGEGAKLADIFMLRNQFPDVCIVGHIKYYSIYGLKHNFLCNGNNY